MSDREPGAAEQPSRATVVRRVALATVAVLVLALGTWWAVADPSADPGRVGASVSPSGSAAISPGASPSASPSTAPGASPGASPEPSLATPPVPATAGPDGDAGLRPTAAPAPLDATATPSPGLSASLVSIEPVTGEATVPGEVGGPALRVTVEVANGGAEAVPLDAAVVNLYFGADGRPAVGLQEPGARPFPATVDPGGTATGVWVFNVPVDQRDDVVVEVDLSVDATVVLFQGPVG